MLQKIDAAESLDPPNSSKPAKAESEYGAHNDAKTFCKSTLLLVVKDIEGWHREDDLLALLNKLVSAIEDKNHMIARLMTKVKELEARVDIQAPSSVGS